MIYVGDNVNSVMVSTFNQDKDNERVSIADRVKHTVFHDSEVNLVILTCLVLLHVKSI